MTNTKAEGVLLALDIGASRIGVARARSDVRLASPLCWIDATDPSQDVMQRIQELITEHAAEAVVVGLPRGLDGQETEQTKTVREFVAGLKTQVQVPLFWQDEALTSRHAEDMLAASAKTYEKGDIDAQAATLILQDFLENTHREHV